MDTVSFNSKSCTFLLLQYDNISQPKRGKIPKLNTKPCRFRHPSKMFENIPNTSNESTHYYACSLVHFFAVFSNCFGLSLNSAAIVSTNGLSALGFAKIFCNSVMQCRTFSVGPHPSLIISAQISPVAELTLG